MSWAEDAALKELNNPNSPYFLGTPSVGNQINDYLNGRGTYYTNYFGANKARYLAPRTADSFEVMNSVKKRNDFNNLWAKIGLGTAGVIGLLIARKIPGLSLIFPLFGQILSGTGKLIGGAIGLIGKLFK